MTNKLCVVQQCTNSAQRTYIDEDGDVYDYCQEHYDLTVRICGASK